MFFTSTWFLIYLLISFCIYWVLPKKALVQNLFLVFASYVFYCYYEWHYVLLLLLITHFAFFYSPLIARAESERKKKWLLIFALTVYLSFLVYFKYLNFFGGIWNDLIAMAGANPMYHFLHLVLPLGISFYTLHMMGYSIDVYYETVDPVTDYPAFMAGASFFPSISSGPIERAGHIVPQMEKARNFSIRFLEDGFNQVLCGIFKKIVIADSIGTVVDYVYARYSTLPASAILIAFVGYALQLYFDFSGYSDIAIGLGKLFGIQLITNFRYPYFATSISAVWRRWHISLTTWFLTYLFNPIAFAYRKKKKFGIFYAAFITFMLSGLWHGASWTFVAWGAIQGSIIGYELLTIDIRARIANMMPRKFYNTLSAWLTFTVWTLILVIFRADSVPQSFDIYHTLFSAGGLFAAPGVPLTYVALGTGFMVVEWFMREKEYPLQMAAFPIYIRLIVYAVVIAGIFSSDNLYHSKAFIYFNY